MPALFHDAHNHLQEVGFSSQQEASYFRSIRSGVVNGTSEQDWPAVELLATKWPQQVVPAYGVHPWKAGQQSAQWEIDLRRRLLADPHATVGEIGLDKWVRGGDFEAQKKLFEVQIELAVEFGRPVTIHCLKAWGTMRDHLRRLPTPRGMLLHAYAGPSEYRDEFLEMGAYFSFSPTFFFARKEAQRAFFRALPLERILVETDAPAMLGPPETWSTMQTGWSSEKQHPSNLRKTYELFAQLLGLELPVLQRQAAANYRRLFLQESA